MPEPHPFLDFLRERTREHHTQVEASPFFAALAAGKLKGEHYLELLRALEIVHEALEHGMACCEHPAVRAVHRPDDARLPLLRQDLAEMTVESRTDTSPALLDAELLAQQIRDWAREDPFALLGCLYVMAGSALGGPLVAAMVVRGFAATGPAPVAYFTSGERSIAAFWKGFTGRMNAAVPGPAGREAAAAAAGATFDAIGEVLRHLCSSSPGPLPRDVHILNPEAGSHPVAGDLREVRATLRAGARSLRENPYYERRYGERGRRFTRSDSAWLAMLAHLPEGHVRAQIDWLAHLLAARGMPRLLLEEHLSLLHRELCAALPEQSAEYDKLALAAADLRTDRLRRLPERAFEALAADFEVRVRPLAGAGVARMGRLLVAAVTDEAAGIERAVPSLEAWVADRARFPPPWVEAVQSTLKEARTALRPPLPRAPRRP